MTSSTASELVIDTFRNPDRADIIALWQACGLVVPWNNPEQDIARKCADSPGLFFTGRVGGRLVASCMAGYDGHRGWIYYLAVHPDCRRRGYAARMVAHSEASLSELGCPKIDLMVRNGNDSVIGFYQAAGYALDPVVVLSKRLQADEPHEFC